MMTEMGGARKYRRRLPAGESCCFLGLAPLTGHEFGDALAGPAVVHQNYSGVSSADYSGRFRANWLLDAGRPYQSHFIEPMFLLRSEYLPQAGSWAYERFLLIWVLGRLQPLPALRADR
jgi:hypothetical protein